MSDLAIELSNAVEKVEQANLPLTPDNVRQFLTVDIPDIFIKDYLNGRLASTDQEHPF